MKHSLMSLIDPQQRRLEVYQNNEAKKLSIKEAEVQALYQKVQADYDRIRADIEIETLKGQTALEVEDRKGQNARTQAMLNHVLEEMGKNADLFRDEVRHTLQEHSEHNQHMNNVEMMLLQAEIDLIKQSKQNITDDDIQAVIAEAMSSYE